MKYVIEMAQPFGFWRCLRIWSRCKCFYYFIIFIVKEGALSVRSAKEVAILETHGVDSVDRVRLDGVVPAEPQQEDCQDQRK